MIDECVYESESVCVHVCVAMCMYTVIQLGVSLVGFMITVT